MKKQNLTYFFISAQTVSFIACSMMIVFSLISSGWEQQKMVVFLTFFVPFLVSIYSKSTILRWVLLCFVVAIWAVAICLVITTKYDT